MSCCDSIRCKLTVGDARHGTENGYGNYKCRCADCKAVKSNASKVYRDSRPDYKAVVTKEQRKKYKLKLRYGITLEEYDAMYEAQNGLCAICNKPDSTKRGILVVDHCHTSNSVRKLLCYNCNSAIGLLNEDYERILAAAEYVRSYHAQKESTS